MTRIRVRRLANPRRVKPKARNKKRKTRRALSPRQIKFSGTKAQKNALKRKRAKARNGKFSMKRLRSEYSRQRAAGSGRGRSLKRAISTVRYNPKRRRVNPKRRKRVSNPELILTMGAVNPRRKKPMAKARKRRKSVRNARRVSVRRRRRSNPVHHRRRRRVARRNPAPRRRRRSNRRRNARVVVIQPRRRSNRRSRRNPSMFGESITSKGGLKLIGGGLVGVAAAKFLPTLLPTSLTGGMLSGGVGRTVITGAAAIVSGMLAGKFVDSRFGDAVLFGGLMQTASVALNSFLPSVYQSLGIGLGEFVPGQFAVPQNPMRQLPAAPAYLPAASGSKVTATRLASAYNPAY